MNKQYIEALEKLWDMLSDAVEEGYIRNAPGYDELRALAKQMVECEKLRDKK